MKAAVVRAWGEPLSVGERTAPEPGPGQVRVRAEAPASCQACLHAAHGGDRPVQPSPRLVPGHGVPYDLDGEFRLNATGRTPAACEAYPLAPAHEALRGSGRTPTVLGLDTGR